MCFFCIAVDLCSFVVFFLLLQVLAFVYQARLKNYYTAQLRNDTFALLPINTFRNVIMDAAPTNHIFPVDIDFVPSADAYGRLRSLILPSLVSGCVLCGRCEGVVVGWSVCFVCGLRVAVAIVDFVGHCKEGRL